MALRQVNLYSSLGGNNEQNNTLEINLINDKLFDPAEYLHFFDIIEETNYSNKTLTSDDWKEVLQNANVMQQSPMQQETQKLLHQAKTV